MLHRGEPYVGVDAARSGGAGDGAAAAIPFAELLSPAEMAQVSVDPAIRREVSALQFFRGLARGLARVGSSGGCVAAFSAALDGLVDELVGASYADGGRWSARWQLPRGLGPALLGETLAQIEEASAVTTTGPPSRGAALLCTLGRLYERSDRLIAAADLPSVRSMRDVCGLLLGPFPGLEPAVRRLVRDHHLQDIPKLAPHLEPAAVAEGVPPQPEPEFAPEPELAPALAVPPSPGSPAADSEFAALLAELQIAHHGAQLAQEAIRSAEDLRGLSDADLEQLGLKMGERRRVLRWSQRACGDGAATACQPPHPGVL